MTMVMSWTCPWDHWHAALLNHPAAVQHVLQTNHRNYSKQTIQYDALSIVTGRGLLTSDGDEWLQQRRLIQPAFHRRRVAQFGSLITGATCRMLRRWSAAAAQNESIDVDEEMMTVTLEIVGRALFSLDLSDSSSEIHHAVLETLEYIVHRAQQFLSWPLAVPTPRNRRFRRALALLDAFVYESIARRREGSPSADGDLLDLLLLARDPESGATMSDRKVRDEVITLLIAGYETVASALIWTFYLLARHPLETGRLRAELDQALDGRLPTVADLPQLPFTRAVFEETLRLYPPAWLITRRARERDTVAGIAIPAGTTLIISPFTVHRHAGFWTDPERFEPGRFLNGGAGGGPPFCLHSFWRRPAPLYWRSIRHARSPADYRHRPPAL